MFHEDEIEALGQLKPIGEGATMADLSATLERHKAAIVQLGGSEGERAAKVERMMAEMRGQLAEIKANDLKARWEPDGSTSDMDRRYLLPDGTVRFKRGTRTITLPDGSTEQVATEGLLGDPKPVTRAQQEMQARYGAFALAVRFAGRDGSVWANPIVRKSYTAFREALGALPGRVGDFCRAMLSDPELHKRVVSNTAGSGGELVEVPQISEIRRPYDLTRRVPGLIEVVQVQNPSFKQPIKTGRVLAKRRGATSNDPARYPIATFTTSEATITVVDRVANVLVDPQWVADAATLIADPMGEIMDWIEMGDADTLEAAFLHGDTAATHQDTLSSWTMGGYYAAGDLDGTSSPLKFWIGFRARAFDDSATVAGGGSFTAATHFAALDAMGNRGANAIAITGLHCLYTQLLQYTNFLTVDKFGPQATVLTGQIGNIFGRPLIISEFVTNDLANTGLYTGSGTTTSMVYVDPMAYTHYSYSGGAGDFDVTYPERGARYVGMTRRGVLAPTCLSTEKPAALIYNL